VTIPLKALVALELDGKDYAPGEWVTLPDGQEDRAQSLLAHGLAEQAPANPVKTSRKRASSS
jgi:hypothetical protein